VGFDKLYAATVLGLGSFLAIAGTILTGTMSDYMGASSRHPRYAISIVGVIFALFNLEPAPGLAPLAARLLLRPDVGAARGRPSRQDA